MSSNNERCAKKTKPNEAASNDGEAVDVRDIVLQTVVDLDAGPYCTAGGIENCIQNPNFPLPSELGLTTGRTDVDISNSEPFDGYGVGFADLLTTATRALVQGGHIGGEHHEMVPRQGRTYQRHGIRREFVPTEGEWHKFDPATTTDPTSFTDLLGEKIFRVEYFILAMKISSPDTTPQNHFVGVTRKGEMWYILDCVKGSKPLKVHTDRLGDLLFSENGKDALCTSIATWWDNSSVEFAEGSAIFVPRITLTGPMVWDYSSDAEMKKRIMCPVVTCRGTNKLSKLQAVVIWEAHNIDYIQW